tara:strand:+ start:5575 stop:6030 length:456 start_codon:yes stop_codon:yes gene_type:complete
MKFPQKAIDRFNSKINKSEDCHIWIAARQKQGYGMFSYDGKSLPAHRFAYLLYKGEIAENMVVHQTCENNACVNPEHLILQTKSQNKRSYSSVRISKEMIEKESVKYLFRLRNLRPDLEKEIDLLLQSLNIDKLEEDDDFGFSKETEEIYV